MRNSTDPTLQYYDLNAEAYTQETQNLDLAVLQSRFLKHIPSGGHILDAGCGSGRDSAAFLQQGYQVTSIDGSPEMVRVTSELISRPATLMDLRRLDLTRESFDGIWAQASLLHLEPESLKRVLGDLTTLLHPGGTLFCSFKFGTFSGLRNGRSFTDLTPDRLFNFLTNTPGLNPIEIWETHDVRPGRGSERWVNSLSEKRAQT